MGARVAEAEAATRSNVEPKSPEPIHDFRNLTAVVHPEGEDAKVTIHTTAGPIKLSVALEYIARANTEIRRAAILMTYRASMKKDEGEASLSEILRTALSPDEVSVVVDKQTGDRFWILQFDGHSPIVIRMTPELGDKANRDLAQILKSTAN